MTNAAESGNLQSLVDVHRKDGKDLGFEESSEATSNLEKETVDEHIANVERPCGSLAHQHANVSTLPTCIGPQCRNQA